MLTSYVTAAQSSKWRISLRCSVINETTDLTWISPVFPLRFCLFQDPVQDITLSSIVLSPWSPPSVTVSVLLFTTLTILKCASRIFCGMSLDLGLPHFFFHIIGLSLWVLGKNTAEVKCLPYHVLSGHSVTSGWLTPGEARLAGLVFLFFGFTHLLRGLWFPIKLAFPSGEDLCSACFVSPLPRLRLCCGPARSRKNTFGPHDSMSI